MIGSLVVAYLVASGRLDALDALAVSTYGTALSVPLVAFAAVGHALRRDPSC